MKTHLKMRTYLFLSALTLFGVFASAEAVTLPIKDMTLWYTFHQPGPFSDQEIFVKWNNDPVLKPNIGVYSAFFFKFQNGVGGYVGTQKDRDGKKAIFSIWDSGSSPTALPVTSPGNCRRFSHEGPGTSCIVPYSWVVGHEYLVKVSYKRRGTNADEWEGTIVDATSGVKTSIGTIALKDSGGYGQLNNNPAGFLEHYGSSVVDSCATLPYAQVTWRGPYANNIQIVATQATVIGGSCANDNVTTAGAPILTVEAGGSTVRSNAINTNLWLPRVTSPRAR